MIFLSWFSAGASSAVATKMILEECPSNYMKIIYIHIEDQHPDTLRFIKDCEQWFGREIEILQSPLKSVENSCRSASYVKSPYGSPCTRLLKRRVRAEWEMENYSDHAYIWGMDYNEKHRADRIEESMPDSEHWFPLIDKMKDKQSVHGILEKAGIKRPEMYEMGYPNNNCIGCLKGGMGYWNKIRIDFPEVFENRCKMERDIGGKIFKEFYLDELEPDRGHSQKIIVPDCGLFCDIN